MAGQRWDLFGFMDALRAWMLFDPPPGSLLARAAEFGAELQRDPERDAELDHANLFLREMPGTEHDGRIVTISFTLSAPRPRGAGEIRCKDVVCLGYPQRELVPGWPPVRHHRQ